MKKLTIIILALGLVMLSACASGSTFSQTESETDSSENAGGRSDASFQDSQESKAQGTEPFYSSAGTQSSNNPNLKSNTQVEKTSKLSESSGTESTKTSKQKSTQPSVQEPALAPSSTPASEPTPQPSPAPAPEPPPQPNPAPAPEPPPQPTVPPTPAFDVGSYVEYALDYGKSIGLSLDSTAIYCWDDPLTANNRCTYLKRDLKDRLDWYAASGFTAFSVWAENTGGGNFLIYIGYA